QEAVEAEPLAVARVAARLDGAAFSHAAKHWHATVHGLNHRLDHTALLVGGERLVFPERTKENDAGDAGLNERRRMARRRVEIERAVLLHLSGDRGEHPTPKGLLHRSMVGHGWLVDHGSSRFV